VNTPLNASASSAGALLSNTTFEVPQFQREYSWGQDEVSEFWKDLSGSLEAESYFLGLIILTDEGSRKHVVDGQQRLITLSLLANGIYHEAIKRDRRALADRISAGFLRSINYDSDETAPRVKLSDQTDDYTFQTLLSTGATPENHFEEGSVSHRMVQSYQYLVGRLQEDLTPDPFKRLGRWTEFLTNRLYFAVFVHPDPSSAYQVYEVINTRGKELTTADLLKNYILSQTSSERREYLYQRWQDLSRQFAHEGTNNFVQFIRHVVTVRSGHVLPKDLFGFLAGRITFSGKAPPVPNELMELLENYLPLYAQMIDSTLGGPADAEALRVFSALNSLGVLTIRPVLLAISDVPDPLDGMKYLLRLVVRRITVGNLGTGNVERRFSEAARSVYDARSWHPLVAILDDLNPSKRDFVEKLKTRSLNKQVLQFIMRSIVQRTITPEDHGILHFIWTRQSEMPGIAPEDAKFWASTIGNTFLSHSDHRPKSIDDWECFKRDFLPSAVSGEWQSRLAVVGEWDANSIETLGSELAEAAGEIWF
jgi:hypothetical protein